MRSSYGKLLVLGWRISERKIEMFAKTSCNFRPGQTVRELLSNVLSVCLAPDIRRGAPEFSDWDSLTVTQGAEIVSIDAECSTLSNDTPILCILDPNKSLPAAEVVAEMLLNRWEEEQKDLEAEKLARRVAKQLTGFFAPSISAIPTSQERHWLSSPAVIGLKRFFHHTSEEIAKKLKANPTRREDGLTDELVYGIFNNPRSGDLLRDLLAPSGVVLELSCEESGSAEKVLGTDLGFCLTVRGGGLLSHRAILLQAKRLHPTPDDFTPRSFYGDLFESRGRNQASRMLDISPCSFFLLYNPVGLNAILSNLGSTLEIRSSLDYSTDGISVLPASIIEGMDRSRWQMVGHLHPFTCSFVKFMVDDFIQGKVGDRSKRALRAALTRKLRREFDLDGDDETPPPRFTVSMTLDVSAMPGFGEHEER